MAALRAPSSHVNPSAPPDLVQHVVATTGLPASVAARVVSDVIGYFTETTEHYVRRRHRELHHDLTNDRIWAIIAAELAGRPVAAPRPTERQLRRIVYG
jgi:hypothetical protein